MSNHIKITVLPGTGAEITGIDLRDLAAGEFEQIKQAFSDHGVVFFRDQNLTETDHITLAERFGKINVNRFFKSHADFPQIALVGKEPDQLTNIGGGWHTDHTYDFEPALDQFPLAFHAHHRQGMAAKLGLTTATQTDEQLVRELLELMQNENLDYTLTFRHLSDPTNHKLLPVRLMPWIEDWLARAATETDGKPDYTLMRSVNPLCIPRNHLIEAVIKAAIEDNDFEPFDALTQALQTPYVERPLENPLTQPPRPDQIVQNTFCGT